jgi:RNA recognition motif-containing protein
MKLLIRNISRTTSQDTLHALFAEFGAVQSCNLVLDKLSGKSKGFAFVEMPKPGEAKAAMMKLNDSELEGSKLRVKKAEQKLEEPPQKDE